MAAQDRPPPRGPSPLPERPEALPAAFAAAWNRRDPDALAALFDEDAEFVNVTGLWWHNRADIRRAHAYGLATIFDRSTLTVGTVRVKGLLKAALAVLRPEDSRAVSS